jgi:hypothetical protein
MGRSALCLVGVNPVMSLEAARVIGQGIVVATLVRIHLI